MKYFIVVVLISCTIISSSAKFAFPPPWKTDSIHQPAWITFIDKGPSVHARLPQREKIERNNPVHFEYVEAVKHIIGEGNIRTESKWLNAISVMATVEELHQIAALNFVKEIDPLHSMKKELVPNHEISNTPHSTSASRIKRDVDYESYFGNATFGMEIHDILPLVDEGLTGEGTFPTCIDFSKGL